MKSNKQPQTARERSVSYGKTRRPRLKNRPAPRTQADRDRMSGPPLPQELDYVAELLAAAKARGK